MRSMACAASSRIATKPSRGKGFAEGTVLKEEVVINWRFDDSIFGLRPVESSGFACEIFFVRLECHFGYF